MTNKLLQGHIIQERILSLNQELTQAMKENKSIHECQRILDELEIFFQLFDLYHDATIKSTDLPN